MLDEKQIKRISKFLSLILRHQPQKINLSLDEYGWANVGELLEKSAAFGVSFTKENLDEVVATNNKKRFAFNADCSKIRASQGHSIPIKLGYEAIEPPTFLYHGTATRFVNSIKAEGLTKQNRHHVHLSADKDTAKNVGSRHGKPVVLIVRAQAMQAAGHAFFMSENKVWLTDAVPTEFLEFPS